MNNHQVQCTAARTGKCKDPSECWHMHNKPHDVQKYRVLGVWWRCTEEVRFCNHKDGTAVCCREVGKGTQKDKNNTMRTKWSDLMDRLNERVDRVVDYLQTYWLEWLLIVGLALCIWSRL